MGLKEENPSLYQLAKQMVLGLGFGMGPKRFKEVCDRAGIGMRPNWRDAITCFDAGPDRDAMVKLFTGLERAGVETIMTAGKMTWHLKDWAKSEKLREVFARCLPNELKIVPRSSNHFEIVLNE